MALDPFEYLRKITVTEEEVIRETGASFYHLLETLGIIGIVLTFIVCGIRLAFAPKGQELGEVKKRLQTEAVIAVTLFGFVFLVGTVMDILQHF